MNAILQPASTNSQEKAYCFLKDSIINLDLKPNQPLRAQDIATRLELSRTPVREALSRLEQEGLVAREGGWGYRVKLLTFKDAINVYRMRETLEVEAIREVIPKLNRELVICLENYLRRAEEGLRKGNVSQYRIDTRAFYRSIAYATDNDILEYMLSLIDDRVRWLGAMITDRHFDRPRESLAENKEILSALDKRDPKSAERAVRRHVSGARESFLRYVTTKSGPLQP